MSNVRLVPPATDPTPIFDTFRSNFATEIMVAAAGPFDLFRLLEAGELPFRVLRDRLSLAERPAIVLLTALCALGLLKRRVEGGEAGYGLTEMAHEHLVPGRELYVGDYIAREANSPGVKELVERLRSNRAAWAPTGPSAEETGTAFTYRPGTRSAMDIEESARSLTLVLAGRAKNVAPVLADRLPLAGARLLLDAGGGTGIYSFAFLQRNPQLRAVLWDREPVLKVAREMAGYYGVADRVEFRPGDMFHDPVPAGCDVVLLSNVLHDWDVPECKALVDRCAVALPPGGRLLVHDVFLNDNLDGPLAVALYSAALFCGTEGRAYSTREYRQWLEGVGLTTGHVIPTLVNCGVLVGTK